MLGSVGAAQNNPPPAPSPSGTPGAGAGATVADLWSTYGPGVLAAGAKFAQSTTSLAQSTRSGAPVTPAAVPIPPSPAANSFAGTSSYPRNLQPGGGSPQPPSPNMNPSGYPANYPYAFASAVDQNDPSGMRFPRPNPYPTSNSPGDGRRVSSYGGGGVGIDENGEGYDIPTGPNSGNHQGR